MQLQLLYSDLLSKGALSIVDALEVGATIEDLDLRDVTTLLDSSDNLDLDTVYQNLAKGSRNHLRAFVDNLAVLAVTYVPAYLDQATFDAIIAADMEHGVYDADGNPIVTGADTGVCDGTAQGSGNGNAGAGGNGTCNGDGTCDGTCDGSGSQGSNGGQGGNGNASGGRP